MAARELGARTGAAVGTSSRRWLLRAPARVSERGRHAAMAALGELDARPGTDRDTRTAVERTFLALLVAEHYWETPVQQRMAEVLPPPALAVFQRLADRNQASAALGRYEAPAAPAPGDVVQLTGTYQEYRRAQAHLDQLLTERQQVYERLGDLTELDQVRIPAARAAVDDAAAHFARRLDTLIEAHEGERDRLAMDLRDPS